MSVVLVTIGPVASSAVLAWAATARNTLHTARQRTDLGVPDHVLSAFEGYVDEWERWARADDRFRWDGELDVSLLRVLGAHWARLVTLARTDDPPGIEPAPPEGEAFYNALALAILEAGASDDREGFSERFEDVVPSFEVRLAGEERADRVRVLVVDDTEDIRLLMRLAIERDGRFEVAGEAVNGSEALEACRAGCPDAVLLDLLMPEMDGYTALPLLKELCPSVNVVVFTAVASPDIDARVRELGASACVSKSAPTETVLTALTTA